MKQAEEQQQFPPPPIAQDLAGVPTPPPSEPPPPYYPPPPTSYAEYEAGLAEKDHEPRPALPPRPGNLQSHSVPSLSSTSQRGSSADSTDGKSSTSTSKSKPTFNERMYKWTTKAAGPINKLTNKLGSEAWWPTALDKECDKCARILKSFVRMSSFPCSITAPTPHTFNFLPIWQIGKKLPIEQGVCSHLPRRWLLHRRLGIPAAVARRRDEPRAQAPSAAPTIAVPQRPEQDEVEPEDAGEDPARGDRAGAGSRDLHDVPDGGPAHRRDGRVRGGASAAARRVVEPAVGHPPELAVRRPHVRP